MNIVVMNECGIYRLALRMEQSSFGSESCSGRWTRSATGVRIQYLQMIAAQFARNSNHDQSGLVDQIS